MLLAAAAVLVGVPVAAAAPPAGPDTSAAAAAPAGGLGLDSDGDGLLNGWELNGYDADGDGDVDVDLPALGADPDHKDVFVEMDYMGAEQTCPCYLPKARTLKRIVRAYENSPRAHNPDGTPGIRMHLDAGPGRSQRYDLGGGNLVPLDLDLNPSWEEFNAIKAANFDPARERIFHYMVWGHGYDGTTSSGYSFGIGADSFMVTLGYFPEGGTADAKVGTFLHEMGHNFGLGHGGQDHDNDKPNYLSVMTYAFQIDGVPRTGGRDNYFGYSKADLPTLDEDDLTESVGLGDSAARKYRTTWWCPNAWYFTSPGTADGPLDWNCNGTASDQTAVDLNGDGWKSSLEGWRDWGKLVFDGGTIGAGARTSGPTAHLVELDADEYNRRAARG